MRENGAPEIRTAAGGTATDWRGCVRRWPAATRELDALAADSYAERRTQQERASGSWYGETIRRSLPPAARAPLDHTLDEHPDVQGGVG